MQATLAGYLQFIQKTKQRQSHCGIQEPKNYSLLRIEAQGLAQQSARQNPVEKLMEKVEEERENERHHWVLDVESHADRGREVSHQGLHDSIHTDRLMGERILDQADGHAVEQRWNGPAAGERKMHGDEQRQLQI